GRAATIGLQLRAGQMLLYHVHRQLDQILVDLGAQDAATFTVFRLGNFASPSLQRSSALAPSQTATHSPLRISKSFMNPPPAHPPTRGCAGRLRISWSHRAGGGR